MVKPIDARCFRRICKHAMIFAFVGVVVIQVVVQVVCHSTTQTLSRSKTHENNVNLFDRIAPYDKRKLDQLLDVFFARQNGTSLNRKETSAFVTKQVSGRKHTLEEILQLLEFRVKFNVSLNQKTNVLTTDWTKPVNNSSVKLGSIVKAKGENVIRFLSWTIKYSSSPHWFRNLGREPFKNCKTPIPCEYTEDKTMYNTSDIILIHPFYAIRKRQMPKYRLPHQKWLFFEKEAPTRCRFNIKRYDSWFNVTYTYTSDADIVGPYGVCLPNRDTIKNNPGSITTYIRQLYGASAESAPWLSLEKIHRSYNRATDKSRLVAWMVSNCNTPSKRADYVKLLKRYIAVDTYGKCGIMTCSHRDRSCDTRMTTYKFYLAFENSLCSEYITEKVWRPLQQGVVPIVLGGADYETYLPKHSYINVKDFPSPSELAKYLKVLDQNDTLYNEYFEWTKGYTCHAGVPGTSVACNMCRHANENINRNETVKRVSEFWSRKHCISPKQFYKGIAHILI